ncbi:MAG: hypothetical protein QXU69_07410 [Thermofilaceae archaeon]
MRVEKVFARWGALEASVLVCYGDELVLGLWPAGLFAYNGSEWRQIYEPKEVGFSAWSYDIFRGRLYVGAGTYGSGLVLEYDGNEVREALRVRDGAGGGGGLFEAVSVAGGTLYAGRRNEVWSTGTGEQWSRAFEFKTGKGVYLIGEQGGTLYIFEGEPIRPPSRVYAISGASSVERVFSEIGAFRSHTPGSRSSYRGYLVVADFDGRVYFFRNFELWEAYSFANRYEIRGNIAIRPKKIGDLLFLASGTGTGVPETHGELVVYNGSEWRRLLTLPLNIHDVEIFGESIYLACNSPALPLKHGYSTSYCCVLKLPIDALGPL